MILPFENVMMDAPLPPRAPNPHIPQVVSATDERMRAYAVACHIRYLQLGGDPDLFEPTSGHAAAARDAHDWALATPDGTDMTDAVEHTAEDCLRLSRERSKWSPNTELAYDETVERFGKPADRQLKPHLEWLVNRVGMELGEANLRTAMFRLCGKRRPSVTSATRSLMVGCIPGMRGPMIYGLSMNGTPPPAAVLGVRHDGNIRLYTINSSGKLRESTGEAKCPYHNGISIEERPCGSVIVDFLRQNGTVYGCRVARLNTGVEEKEAA